MNPSAKAIIEADLAEAAALRERLPDLLPAVEEAALLCAEALRRGGKLVFFGNGGSAADAQHLAAEFVGRFERERSPLPAIALTVNTSVLTAVGNDEDFSAVFERQIRALVTAADVAIGLSTSGDSANVLRGIEAAKAQGAKTIGFSGSRGKLRTSADVVLAVPSAHTARIQEAHILLGHILTHVVETQLAG